MERLELGFERSPAMRGQAFPVRAQLFVLLYGLTLLAANLTIGRTMTFHEAIYAHPAREMLATGDWLIPRIAGVPFVEKPPLTPWLVAISMWITGSEAEWVARIPNVLSTLFTVWIVSLTASRWFGVRVGVTAGVIQCTIYYSLQMSTLAEPDMHLIACVTGAMCLFAWNRIDSPIGRVEAWWLPLAYFGLAGLSFMAKGPIGSVFIFGGCGLFTLLQRDWGAFRLFFHPLGILVYFAMFVPYCVAAYLRYPPYLDTWILHNVGRFRGELGGGTAGEHAVLFYAYMLPTVLLPWLPSLLWGWWKDANLRFHTITRFAICWLIPGLGVLCLATFRSKHYLSPLLPGFTIVAAVGFQRFLETRAASPRLYSGAWLAFLIASLGLAAYGVATKQPYGWRETLAMLAVVGVLFAGLVFTERLRRAPLQAGLWFASTWLIVAATFQLVMPAHDSYRAQTEFARTVNATVPENRATYFVGFGDSQMPYYLRLMPTRVDDLEKFVRELPERTHEPLHIVIEETNVARLKTLGSVQELARCERIQWWQKEGQRPVLVRWERAGDVVVPMPVSRGVGN